MHGVQNPAVNRLQPVPHVRQRPGDDYRHGIFEKAFLHLFSKSTGITLFGVLLICSSMVSPISPQTLYCCQLFSGRRCRGSSARFSSVFFRLRILSRPYCRNFSSRAGEASSAVRVATHSLRFSVQAQISRPSGFSGPALHSGEAVSYTAGSRSDRMRPSNQRGAAASLPLSAASFFPAERRPKKPS